ncbi:tRNA (cytosine(72)-C(5))-methyltransferase NSUN6 isoform X2 [Contarinia nasturtii]|nr:tRNA (cytosine(72)-C(5))-methyltransferase NSUN6 isoform X2 [Contarinia nasturtii]
MTPKTTTVRVNLLSTSTNHVIANILKMFEQCTHLPCLPLIERFDAIPEMIMIHSLDERAINKKPCPERKEVIVDGPCAAAVLRGAHIYCPGILAMQTNTKLNEIVNIFGDIEGACKKGTNIVYDSVQKLFIGTGQVKMQRHQLFGTDGPSKGIGVEVHQTISCVPSVGSEYLSNQSSLLQNFPSIVCSRVLDPKPNEIVLDMCASPGNKTTHLAQLMEDSGVLVALDKSENRVIVLKENIKRFHLKSVHSYTFDATKAIDLTMKQHKNDFPSHPPYAEESFDKILLDAPCSGLGNRPILSTKLNRHIVASFPKLQKKLLDTALRLLKVGGTLVYSTCSVLDAENERNVAYMLEKYGKVLELETATPVFGNPGLKNAGLSDDERRKVQRFGPDFENPENQVTIIDSTGFFICKFRKIAKLN